MRRSGELIALIVLVGLGGCAHPAPSQTVAGTAQPRPAAQRSAAIPCSVTELGIATVSRCGNDRMSFGVAAE